MKDQIKLIVLIYSICLFGCNKAKIEKVESTLGIEVPAGTKVSGGKTLDGQDYEENLILEFTDDGMINLLSQVKKSKYFDLKHDFYGWSEVDWKSSDTIFYWTVRNYLKEKHLTGYWIVDSTEVYVFHQPDLSDIPNSSILFNEAFDVTARIIVNEKVMEYHYIKY